ncbi:MAG: 3-dehydroquinate synthase [Oscillospiraceae bacterium]|jgi:3-dehydroquinate synthase
MQKVTVNASKKYDVIIGSGLLQQTGRLIGALRNACCAAVITDDKVEALYYGALRTSLEHAGFCVHKYVIPNGEASKNLSVFADILEFLAGAGLSRSDIVIALGGGVVGDLAGFAASCYLRGVDLIQLPTTLLSAVDSSVGGKTGVDLKSGKNLAGAFWQPSLVVCDIDTLSSLPRSVFSEGLSECIKYGVIGDRELFGKLKAGCPRSGLEGVVLSCVRQKADLVEKDEFDNGVRQYLNLGHTFGHAIEKCSSYSIPHGQAVAIGMSIASKSGEKRGITEAGCHFEITAALKNNSLPYECSYGAHELAAASMSDKKRRGDYITLVIPKRIGKCVLHRIEASELEGFIADGL